MDDEKLVSVIIPMYNVEKYVRECLESVLTQTYLNIEVVVVNDGSTDQSAQICKEFKDPRIVLVEKSNGGISDARNKGVEVSKGDYILFVDSDDVIHPDLVEELVNNLSTYDGDVSGCNFVKFEDGKDVEWETHNFEVKQWNREEVLDELVGGCSNELTMGQCKLYHRDIILANPYPSGKIHEDEFVSYKILGMCKHFVYSGKKLYGYRQRSNSIMSTYSVRTEQDRVEAKQQIFEYYQKHVKEMRSVGRAYFLLMRNIELSYSRIYSFDKHAPRLSELTKQFDALYKKNISVMRYLNFYEKVMLVLFYRFKLFYWLIERVRKELVK